jgi:hypothetical protein
LPERSLTPALTGTSIDFSPRHQERQREREIETIEIHGNSLFPFLCLVLSERENKGRGRERKREKQEKSSATTIYKLSEEINGQLHHIQPVFLEPTPTEMSAVNMSMMMMMVGLVIATICLLNANGEEEKVGT